MLSSVSSYVAPGNMEESHETSPPHDRITNTTDSRGTSRLMKNFRPLKRFWSRSIAWASLLASSCFSAPSAYRKIIISSAEFSYKKERKLTVGNSSIWSSSSIWGTFDTRLKFKAATNSLYSSVAISSDDVSSTRKIQCKQLEFATKFHRTVNLGSTSDSWKLRRILKIDGVVKSKVNKPKHWSVKVDKVCHNAIINVRCWCRLIKKKGQCCSNNCKKVFYFKSSLMVYKNCHRLSLDFYLIVNAFHWNKDLSKSFGSNDIVHKLNSESSAKRDQVGWNFGVSW